MKINKLWALVLGMSIFASCEEIGPSINFVDVQPDPDDTTYVVSMVPTPEPRNVYVEEFTGVTCPNCPAGHDIIKSAKANATSPERVVAVGYYKFGLILTSPRPTTDDDFRDSIANKIDNAVYGGLASSLPIAGIDRTSHGGSMLLDRALWAANISSRLNAPTTVNLQATSTYDEASKSVKVKVTATFTSAVNKKAYVTIGMYQDSIIDAQEKQGVSHDIEDYEHNHVFRQMITPTNENGVELGNTGTYEPGRVYVRSFTATVDDARYVPEKCSIFVIIHHSDGTTKEVLQAKEIHMK